MGYPYLSFVAYALSLLADPCVWLSAAVACSVGGRSIFWGAAFASLHLVFGAIGLSISVQVGRYSEVLSHLISALLVITVLLHVVRSAFKHGCETCHEHEEEKTSQRTMIVASFSAVALHALGSGFVLSTAGQTLSFEQQVATLAFGALGLGILISAMIHKREAMGRQLIRLLNIVPGLAVSLLLILLTHLVAEMSESSAPYYKTIIIGLSIVIGAVVQWKTYLHRHSNLQRRARHG